jgi:bacteriocin-like protein
MRTGFITMKNGGITMTVEQVKTEAKKRFGVTMTDEAASAWLEKHPGGELSDDELANVTGGAKACDGDTIVHMAHVCNRYKRMPGKLGKECSCCFYFEKVIAGDLLKNIGVAFGHCKYK